MIIPKSKFGDCSKCGAKDTDVVKIKKDLFCLACNREIKTKNQLAKANQRNQLRQLGNKQVANGNYFEAERQALMNDLDFVVSRICRMTYSDSNGQCQCYTCPTKNHFSLMQAGHYVGRANTQLRFDLKYNIRPQCKICNEAKHGNLDIFTERLEQEEKGITEQLKQIAREPYKWTREELKMLLIDFRTRLRTIETKFKT